MMREYDCLCSLYTSIIKFDIFLIYPSPSLPRSLSLSFFSLHNFLFNDLNIVFYSFFFLIQPVIQLEQQVWHIAPVARKSNNMNTIASPL